MLSSRGQGITRRTKPSKKAVLFIAALILIVLSLDALAVYRGTVQARGKRFDFYPRWLGVRVMLFEGRNPYSPEIGQRIRTDMQSTGYHRFLYPAFIAFTIPHFLLPFPWAITLWIVTQHVLLILTVLMLTYKRASKPLFVCGAILAATIYPLDMTAIVLGQFSIYVLFYLVLAYWLWNQGYYLLAGCALTQLLVKPQLTFLVVAFWLLLAVKEKRWRFVTGFGATLGLLTVLPMFFIGNWLDDFLLGAGAFQETAYEAILPGQWAQIMEVGLSVLLWPACLLLWLRLTGWLGRRLGALSLQHELGYLISLTLAISALTTPRVRNYDLVIALFAIIYGAICLQGQRGMRARVLRLTLWGTPLVIPWISVWIAPNNDPGQIDRLALSGVLLVAMLLLPWVARPRAAGASATQDTKERSRHAFIHD
jgi:hypothetical protein